MFEHKIREFPNFSDIFIKGSQNYRKSAVEDHAKNKGGNPKHPHSVAYKLYLEGQKSIDLEERSQTLSSGKMNIVSCFNKMPPEDFERMKKSLKQFIFLLRMSYLFLP